MPSCWQCLGFGRSAAAADYHLIKVPGSTLTWPLGINASGTVVGFYLGATLGFQGFLLGDNSVKTIDFPNAPNTLLSGINALGDVLGYYDDGINIHGFTYRHGHFRVFDYPGAANTYATDINNRRQIVGFCVPNGVKQFSLTEPAGPKLLFHTSSCHRALIPTGAKRAFTRASGRLMFAVLTQRR